MTKHLFLITIGPVQEFIAAARRTRDLWAGSQLLSALSRTAADALRNTYGATLIFPAQEDLKAHDVVNRIVALLPTGADPGVIGEQVEKHIRAQLTTDIADVFDTSKRITWPDDEGYRKRAEAQVADLIEITWAAAPLVDNASGTAFQVSRERLEAALAARKYTRTFRQPAWGLPVPKSSIDGVRESVIDENDYPAGSDSLSVRKAKVERLFYMYGAGRAERLSGVDLFKRHYQPKTAEGNADFPSTSHFAALPLLTRLDAQGLDYTAALRRYIATLGEVSARVEKLNPKRFAAIDLVTGYDASILFEERLADVAEEAELREARGALADFFASATGGERPEPYYAILLADGDNMGKVIDNQPGVATLQALALALDAFAGGVRARVESADHHGALVYAGGDDVLAFLPLDTALACAHALHESYHEHMHEFLAEQGYPSTLSVGIAICHHLEPLSDALGLVRKAEQAAKALPEKNGLAIILSKRGGSDRTTAGGWGGPFYKRLLQLIDLHREDAIPDGAAYDLHDLALRVGRTLPPEALRAEALRIVKRKRGQHGDDGDPNADLLALAAELPASTAAAQAWGVAQLATELIITREFARAWGPISQKKGVTA
ncbi:type III-B CRISPR-associated protein Cas10/Cmr2 [Oscillochloris sp. ZM17-4]|uniref:type III-B CRISPR-associated protein Cas10/Cmr2 n=1 Tax=Oscillochloris sp. ZM17-4 TaxID=2866714 RepID=UPI001C7316EB|nr:type III-B CRISPR-associated protein Cas10/Cmr2 [Oscillochloris sp. ZM17-4]MBX0331284.1 type III-B CRISPR-associated protein Cas10/Cmr2 [Oscillochloris sp. ZM17-4]